VTVPEIASLCLVIFALRPFEIRANRWRYAHRASSAPP
jgi:hypothetical protein